MKLNFDIKGFWRTLKLTTGAAIIIFTGIFVTREFIIPLVTGPIPPRGAAEENLLGVPDENVFYIDLPAEKPIFLPADDVTKKKEALIWEKKDFLYIDLSQMSLTAYEEGAERKSFKIASRAKPDGFFETPSGFYKIQGKSENHISKIEGIRLPWSIYLYGNYLVHGNPILKNGRKAAENFEGGGVRLADNDAKELFNTTKNDVAVLVYDTTVSQLAPFTYFRRTALPHRVPAIGAASALAVDLETGKVLFEKNKSDAYPIASITKLMTALVATEKVDDSKILTATKEALAVYGDSAGLIAGEELKSKDLLYALILPSSNDVTEIYKLAVENLVGLMNEKAKELGLSNTFFADTSGLSKENISSAEDLRRLLKYLDENAPRILEISQTQTYSYKSENKKRQHVWKNINWPTGDKRFLGGKAGFTDDSLQTMAGIYNVRVSEYGGRKIAIVVLGSRNRIGDVRAIINYIENEFIYGASLSAEKQNPLRYGAALYETLRY